MLKSIETQELPSVNLSGNLYYDSTNLAGVLQGVLEDELPAVGITHTSPLGIHTTQEENHRWDRVVLINTLRQLSPANGLFLPVAPSAPGLRVVHNQPTLAEGTPGHYDAEERIVAADGLIMVLRLHTADNINGAYTKFANAYSGRTGFAAGDSGLFVPGQDSPEAITRGYETLRRVSSDQLIELALGGIPDPNLMEETIYSFEEAPGTSVIFKANSSFGPRSMHEFEPIDPSLPRTIATSDVSIYSNPPEELDEDGNATVESLSRYWQNAAAYLNDLIGKK